MQQIVKGYKASLNMVCRNYKYKVGRIHRQDELPVVCRSGFHFCRNAEDVLSYYPLDEQFVLMEVESRGVVVEAKDKCATNQLKVIRKLSQEETAKVLGVTVKTVPEMIQKLKIPKQYKDLALFRFERAIANNTYIGGRKSMTHKVWLDKYTKAESVIEDSFIWRVTPEGPTFWDDVQIYVVYKGPLPAIPADSLKELKEDRKKQKAL